MESPRLIIICGHPGAGKTTTAHRIRKAIENAVVVSRDLLKNPHIGNGSLDEYSNKDATIIDRKFYDRAGELLSTFTTVILDATFRERAKREVAYEFARKHGCDLLLIECICCYAILLRRLQHQMRLGHKQFIKPPEEVLKYYIENTQPPDNEMSWGAYLKLNTESKHPNIKFVQTPSCQFAAKLIEILEQPFDPSQYEAFCAHPVRRNGETQKSLQINPLQIEVDHKHELYQIENLEP